MRATEYLEALPSYLKARGVDVRGLARSLKCSIGDIEALSVTEHPRARFRVFLEVLRTLGDELEDFEDASAIGVLEHIERTRVRACLTVTDLMKTAGLSRTHYSGMLRNHDFNPRLRTMLRLAAAADCELMVRERCRAHQFGATCKESAGAGAGAPSVDNGTPPQAPNHTSGPPSGPRPTTRPFVSTCPEGDAKIDDAPPPPRPEPAATSPEPPQDAGSTPPRFQPAATSPEPLQDASSMRASFLRFRPRYSDDEIDDGWMKDDPDLEAELEAEAEASIAQMFGGSSPPFSPGGPPRPPQTNIAPPDLTPAIDPRQGALNIQEILEAKCNDAFVSAPIGTFTFSTSSLSYERHKVPPLNFPVEGDGHDRLECSTRLIPDPPPKR